MNGFIRNCICHCPDLEVFTCACKVMPEHIETIPNHYIEKLKDFVSQSKQKLSDYQKQNFLSTNYEINQLLSQTNYVLNYDDSTLLESIRAQEKSFDLITKKLTKKDVFAARVSKSLSSFENYLNRANNLEKNKMILTKILQKINKQLIIVFRPGLVYFYDCYTRHWKKLIFPGITYLSSIGFPYRINNSSFFYFKMRSDSNFMLNFKFDIIEKKVYELPQSNILYYHSNPVLFNQRVYFFGGRDAYNQDSNYAEFFDVNHSYWAGVSFMPRADKMMISIEYSGFIYILSKRYQGFLEYNINNDIYNQQSFYSNEEIFFVCSICGVFYYIGKKKVYYCDDSSNLVFHGNNDALSDELIIRDFIVLDDKAYFAGSNNKIYCFSPNFEDYRKVRTLDDLPNLD